MFFKRMYNILAILIKFRVRIFKTFRLDSIFAIISNIIFLIGTILFWLLISEAGFTLKDWTYENILVFIAFSELFYGFSQNVFSSASEFWKVIYTGSLDVQILRPFDVRARFILLNIDYLGLLLSFIKVAVILIISHQHVSFGNIIFASLVIFTANYILMLMRFIISYFSFKLGKTEMVTQICDSITKFNKYPMVIFPTFLRIIFTVLFPFYFFSTFSAEYVIKMINGVSVIYYVIALIGNLILWSLLNNFAWKIGRMNYESING